MQHSRFMSLLLCAAMFFIVNSCGDSEQKNSTDATADTSSAQGTTPVVAPGTNTIVTIPQGMVIVQHKVANFSQWFAAYEAHDSVRLANGVHNYVIGRGAKDSNIVMVALKVDDMEKAKTFAKDPGFKRTMQKAGVVGTPSVSFVTTTFQDTVALGPNILRSRTSFTVKDWDAWQKAFETGNQERIDNGLTVRTYGHDADDSKKVFLVVALIDTARASSYWKSDLLKKRRAESGVTTEPVRFIFRIVKRY